MTAKAKLRYKIGRRDGNKAINKPNPTQSGAPERKRAHRYSTLTWHHAPAGATLCTIEG